MSIFNYFCEKSMKFTDFLNGMKMDESFNFLMKSQWWSESEINNYQNEKLQFLIKNTYENVEYYNEVFKKLKLKPSDIKTKADLHKIPLLTKEDIQRNFPKKMVNRNIKKSKLVLGASSGSTGRPVHYYKTKDSLSINRSANLRGWYWAGFRLGDPYLKIATMERNSLSKQLQDYFIRSYYYKYVSLGNNELKEITQKIQKKKYRGIRGTPSTLYVLAKYIVYNNIPNMNVDIVITTSEPLFPSLRSMIESVFSSRVFDSYGSEGAPVIFECETHECYHVSQEVSILEYMDMNDGLDKTKKKAIVTDLTNYATPLIRYDINDIIIPTDHICSCGRKLKAVKSIEGRDSDIILTPSGKYMTFNYFAGFFKHKQYIELFQLKQVSKTDFELRIIPNLQFEKRKIDLLYKELQTLLGEGAKVSIQVVDDIPLTKSGKRRFLVREKNIDIHL